MINGRAKATPDLPYFKTHDPSHLEPFLMGQVG